MQHRAASRSSVAFGIVLALVLAIGVWVACALLFVSPVEGQESTNVEATDTEATELTKDNAAESDDEPNLEVQVEEQRVEAQVAGVPAPPSGPLAGEVVEVRDRNDSDKIDRGDILLIRADCEVEPGASITVEDGNPNDNTQGTFVDDQNATITTEDGEIEIEVTGATIGKVPVPPSGDNELGVRGVEVVTSTGIQCGGDDGGGGNGGGNGGGTGTGDGTNTGGTNTGTTQTTTGQTTTAQTTTAQTSTPSTTAETTTAEVDRSADFFRCEEFLHVVRDDRGALLQQYQDNELIVRRFEQCLSADVLANTIPRRLLPGTGGVSLLGIVAIGLASLIAGAFVLRAALRRGR